MTNQKGRFGIHGGQYIPETLMNAVIELENAYNVYKADPEFNRELTGLFNEYAGRPSRLYFAKKMTEDLGGARIYLKREDLNHTGAHKINNVLGQALLAKKMGKTRLIAETGAGQHGVATATAAALFGMECVVFMGEEDTIRQALNVYRMRLLGAKVIPVTSGTATLKDAVSEAMREWTSRISDTHYCLGSVMGPHPFPTIVRDFQSVISKEIRLQMLEKEGKLPDAVIACVGGGSNAIGSFYHFIDDPSVRLIGCEAAGRGIGTFETAATINTGKVGIFHGMKSYFCQDEYGQIAPVYSISAGLDYPGIGPEHAHLYDIGRAEYVPVTDEEAVDAFEYLAKTEGIIPAIESAHAVAYAMKLAREAVRNGADLIELGIPFSDPTAEGPVIQGANIRALSGGITTDRVFDMVRELRKEITIPFVFMTYANVVFTYGADRFFALCGEIGVDGIILPDLPFEEREEFLQISKKYQVDLISLIAPTSEERIGMIAKEAEGFLYLVSSLGVTGMRNEINTDLESIVRIIRKYTEIPCAIGFGISTPEQAKKMAGVADGVIVGSAIVKLLEKYGKTAPQYIGSYIKEMKDAVKNI